MLKRHNSMQVDRWRGKTPYGPEAFRSVGVHKREYPYEESTN
jgi:hypothetical protein